MIQNLKTIFNLKKYSKYLFLPGLFLSIVGAIAAFVAGSWSPIPVGLIVTGIIIIFLWLGFLQGSFWGRRSTQAGTNALIATLAVIIILGIINFLASRYYLRVDLTENQLFTLSSQSQQIVKNLQQPLKIWIFTPVPDRTDRELLKNYRRYGSKFEFEFVDPQIQPGVAKRFNAQSIGDVYLEYGNKRQLVQTLTDSERLSEVKLTNTIEKIQRDRTPYIYFLQGHGEPPLQAAEGGFSEAVSSLEDKGYEIETINLAQSSQIPKNTSAIVIAGPKRALLPGEIKVLRDYLNAGGRILLMLNPNIKPGLELLLKDWGVQLDDRIVIDASGTGNILGFGPAIALITQYGDHPITKDFGNGISVYPEARAIKTLPIKEVKAVELLMTDKQTWAESELSSEVKFDSGKDIQGPLDIAVALTRTSSQDKQKKAESRLIVFGDSDFATNGWIKQQLNGDVFLNSINWLANDDGQVLAISPKEPKNRRIKLTPLQAGLISSTALLIMPAFGLIAAGITWWKRR